MNLLSKLPNRVARCPSNAINILLSCYFSYFTYLIIYNLVELCVCDSARVRRAVRIPIHICTGALYAFSFRFHFVLSKLKAIRDENSTTG